MRPRGTLDWLAGAQRRMEERLIEDDGETPPALAVLTRGELALLVLARRPWALVELAPLAVAGMAGDELHFVSDTFFSRSETNPEGRRWSSGEMQRRAHEPAVRALLQESLVIMRTLRGGESCMATAPYERQSNRIVWGEARVVDVPSGPMWTALQEAVRVPWLSGKLADAALPPAQFGLSELEAVAHAKAATIRAMAERAATKGDQVAFALPSGADPRECEIVEESMLRAGLSAKTVTVDSPRAEWWRGGQDSGL